MSILGVGLVLCFCSALLRWNEVRYRKKGLPPGTMGLPPSLACHSDLLLSASITLSRNFGVALLISLVAVVLLKLFKFVSADVD